MTEPLITVEQAAEILGFAPNWIYTEAAAGRLPSYLFGRQRKFRASELEAFIQSHAQGKMATVTPIGGRRQ